MLVVFIGWVAGIEDLAELRDDVNNNGPRLLTKLSCSHCTE